MFFKGNLGSVISGLVVVSHTIPKFCKHRISHDSEEDTKFSHPFAELTRDLYRVFSHDVTAAILVFQSNEMAAMLVSHTNIVGVKLFSYANAFLCSNKLAYMLAT